MSSDLFGSDETGILEFDKNIHVVSKNYMIKLRKILDRVKIPYILDRVSFHSTTSSLALAKAIHNTNVWKVEKDGGVNLDSRFGHSGKFRYNHLVVLDLELIKTRLGITGLLTGYDRFVLWKIT